MDTKPQHTPTPEVMVMPGTGHTFVAFFVKDKTEAKELSDYIVRAVNLLAQIEKMSIAKCICQDSGCLACISKRVLKVFETEGK